MQGWTFEEVVTQHSEYDYIKAMESFKDIFFILSCSFFWNLKKQIKNSPSFLLFPSPNPL